MAAVWCSCRGGRIMELDKRIIEGKKPLDCFDIDIAKQFIGKKGFFGAHESQFMNLDTCPKCVVDELKEVDNYDACPFTTSGNHAYRLFLPAEWVKEPEKKWRPYTGIEFTEKFDLWVGNIIRIRDLFNTAGQEYEYKILFVGYRWYKGIFEVFINGCWIDLVILFKLYEYVEDGEWHKFGVLDEE